MQGIGAGFTLVLVLFLLVLAVLWIVLPFAVFGLKKLVRDAIDVLRENNRQLTLLVSAQERLARELEKARQKPDGAC